MRKQLEETVHDLEKKRYELDIRIQCLTDLLTADEGPMPPATERVLEYLKEEPRTSKNIADALKLKPALVYSTLNRLLKRGRVAKNKNTSGASLWAIA